MAAGPVRAVGYHLLEEVNLFNQCAVVGKSLSGGKQYGVR